MRVKSVNFAVMEVREKEIYKVTLIGSLVNAVLIVLKLIAGIFGRSSALVADAIHSLSDFVTDVIVLIFVKIAGKPSDEDHGYGHGKYETFATMIIGLILIGAGIGLMVNSIEKILHAMRGGVLEQPTYLALIIALVGILSKEWLFRYTRRVGLRVDSQVVVANAWHHRSDAISSGGTLLGVAGAMFLGEHWRILDPIAAALVSVFIIKSGIDIMRPSVKELLEESLPEEDVKQIEKTVLSIPGIDGMHHLRTRKVGNATAMDMHVKMDGNMTLREAHDRATAAEKAIRSKFGKNTIINIHMEPFNKESKDLITPEDIESPAQSLQ